MKLETLEDIQSAFPDEDSARKYLFNLRWGGRAICPYCNNDKAYFIENNKRFKCANRSCHKKFSVTVKTILEATNLPLNVWLGMILVFVKSRGRISSYDMVSEFKIASKNEFFVREKLEFAWKYIDRIGKSNTELLDEMLSQMIKQYPAFHDYRNSDYYYTPHHVDNIDNIGDAKQYNVLHRYTTYYVNVYCRWIWLDFARAGDILSEAFLWMSENGVKEYNAESIIKIIQQTVNRMWFKFLSEHPRYNEWSKRAQKKQKEHMIINLTDSYLIDIIKRSKAGKGLTTRDIKQNRELINKAKERILKKRKKLNRNFDFISHFS